MSQNTKKTTAPLGGIEGARARHRRWSKKNPEKTRVHAAKWKYRNPEKWKAIRRRVRMKAYGLTPESYDALLLAQNGTCAICRRPERRLVRGVVAAMSVDHDHSCCDGPRSCGRCVRGLLCDKCNKAIGIMSEDVALLTAAAEYLRNWSLSVARRVKDASECESTAARAVNVTVCPEGEWLW